MVTRKKTTSNPVLRILIIAKDREMMRTLLSENQLDISCGGPKQREDGSVSVDAYVPRSGVSRLKKYGVKIDLIGDESATLRARQKEVGKGNRFEGENRVPRGLGRKVKEEEEDYNVIPERR